MAAETGLLLVGQLLVAGGAAATIASLRPGGDPYEGAWGRAASWLTRLAPVPVTVASLLLLYYFWVPDLSVEYVWSFTSVDYPWYYRLSGFWGGQDGSLLLWAWITTVVAAVAEHRYLERRSTTWPIARGVVLLLAVILLSVVVQLDPFSATPDAFRTLRPEGNGISPLLLSPFMLIHPPVQFVGYALAALPAGFAAGHLLVGGDEGIDETLTWSRWFWLFLTSAIGLGGLWAYYVLSFGGYWAWDPVETANLLPWIALTMGLHALVYRKRRGQYRHLAPLSVLLALALVWFSTFVTRTGLWVSVHSFVVQSSTIQDPLARFLTITARSALASTTLTVLLGILGGTGLAFLYRFYRDTPVDRQAERSFYLGYGGFVVILLIVATLDARGFVRFGFEVARLLWAPQAGLVMALLGGLLIGLPALVRIAVQPGEEYVELEGLGDVVTQPNLVLVSILLLFTSLSVTLLLLLIGINGTQPQVYDSRAPFIAIPTATALTVLFLRNRIGAARSLLLAVGALVAGIVASLLTDPAILGLGVPVLTVAAAAGGVKVLEACGVTSWPDDRATWSGVLLVVSGLLGVATWASPPSSLSLGVVVLEPGLAAAAAGLVLSVATLAGGVATLREGPGRSRWAVVAGVLAFGWYVGAVLAVAAGVLGWGRGAKDRPVRPMLKRAGVWTIHLGVVLLMVGYGTSTFLQQGAEWDQADPIARGVGEPWQDYTFTMLGAEGEDTLGEGFYDRLWIDVAVARDGERIDTGRMLLYWGDATGNYVPQVYISRNAVRDLYLVPDGVHTPDQGWTMANGVGNKLQTDDVDQVAMRVQELPGVNLLWTGYVLVLAGMGLHMVPRTR